MSRAPDTAAPMPAWLSGARGAWRVSFHVQPGAPRTEPLGEIDARLKLRIAAPPVDGKANEALVRWCAERLGVARSAVRIDAGASSRYKRVSIASGLDAPALVAALTAR